MIINDDNISWVLNMHIHKLILDGWPPILCVEYFKHRVDLALSTVIYDGCNWFMFNHIPRLVMCLFNELIVHIISYDDNIISTPSWIIHIYIHIFIYNYIIWLCIYIYFYIYSIPHEDGKAMYVILVGLYVLFFLFWEVTLYYIYIYIHLRLLTVICCL